MKDVVNRLTSYPGLQGLRYMLQGQKLCQQIKGYWLRYMVIKPGGKSALNIFHLPISGNGDQLIRETLFAEFSC